MNGLHIYQMRQLFSAEIVFIIVRQLIHGQHICWMDGLMDGREKWGLIIAVHDRVTDIIGRTGQNEF